MNRTVVRRLASRYLLSREPIPNALEKFRLFVEGDELGKVADDILRGIGHSADLCKLSPPACTGNLGIPRVKMPQFRSKYQQAFLDSLEQQGVSVAYTKVAAGRLKATQKELNAEAVLEMTVRFKMGDYHKLFTRPVLISEGDYILDGHHRWATILTISPGAKVPVARIGMPIRELFKLALNHPLVQHSDFHDT
jgi:hypothetical protein